MRLLSFHGNSGFRRHVPQQPRSLIMYRSSAAVTWSCAASGAPLRRALCEATERGRTFTLVYIKPLIELRAVVPRERATPGSTANYLFEVLLANGSGRLHKET